MFKKLNINVPKIFTIVVYLAIFTSLIFPYRDKDWGWHYRYGEYLLEHGKLLVKDVYSWTMSGYAWTNHSWLFDPILFIISKLGGFTTLALVGSFISLICFYLLVRSHRLDAFALSLAGLFFVNLIEPGARDGLRSQSLAFLPLTILLTLVSKLPHHPRLLYTIPPLFLVWTNLHASFIYGLGIMGVFFIIYFFRFPLLRLKLILITALTILATLINPFGYHPYLEAFRHSSSPYLRNVYEWIPLELKCDYCHVPTFTLYLLLISLAALSLPLKQSLPYILLAIALILPTIGARRYLPLFTISTFPLLLAYLATWQKYYTDKFNRLIKFLIPLLIIITLEYNLFTRLPSFHFYNYTEESYCLFASGCSVEQVNYLIHNPPVGYGLNFYDWGGYLIGKDFPAKLFVDGRMHVWSGKGYTAFGDYIKMYYHTNTELFNQYNFDWLLIQPDSPLANKLRTTQSLGSWEIKYQDKYSLYLIRN